MTDPSPELTWQQLFAAYADGELDAAARRRAEEWLRQHPDAAADLAAQRALSPRNEGLWNVVEPPVPTESRWNEIQAKIERRLFDKPEPRRPPARGRWLRRGLLAAALVITGSTAAAVIVAGLPSRQTVVPFRPVIVPPIATDPDDVFAITLPDDVDIVSMRHADSSKLVIGQPPVHTPLVLASAGDVTMGRVEPDSDGNMPVIQMGENDVPGILVPPRDP